MTLYLRRNTLLLGLSALIILAGLTRPAWADSVQDLVGQLKSTDEPARLKAIDELGAQGAKAAEAVAPLAALLKDSSAAVRARAALALGEIGAPAKTAASDLTSLLKDAEPSVRRQAVKALLAIRPGPRVMIPLMIRLLGDSDPGVQVRVLNAIAEAGEPAVPGLTEALKNDKAAYWACVVLREIGPAAKGAAPALAEKLKDRRPDIRMQAVLALGAIGEASPPVLERVADSLSDQHVRTAATFVLGQLGKMPAGAEEKIRANAKSDDRLLSTVSLWTLARIHPEDKELRRQATEQIVARLADQNPYVRVMAARALAALPPAPEITLPIFEKAMERADAATVRHALDALAMLGAPAVPRLVDAVEKHKELRAEIAYTLGRMGPAAAPATEALAKLVPDGDLNVATEATIALGRIGPAAKSAVPALCAALDRKEETNAHAIILALGEIGPEAAAAEPMVLKAMESKDLSLAVIAATALVRIKARSADAVAKALPVLVAGLADALPETRKTSAETLGELGPLAREAAPALKKAAEDPKRAVAEAAAKALKAVE